MKKAILFIAAAIAITLTSCKKEPIKPLEARYHVIVTHKGDTQGKLSQCKFDISGLAFAHTATFGAEGHTFDTTVVAPWPPVVKYRVHDAIAVQDGYELDYNGQVTVKIYHQNGQEIVNAQGSKEVANY